MGGMGREGESRAKPGNQLVLYNLFLTSFSTFPTFNLKCIIITVMYER